MVGKANRLDTTLRNEPLAPSSPAVWDYAVFDKRKAEMGGKVAGELLIAFKEYAWNIRSVASSNSFSDAIGTQLRHDFSPIADFLGFVKIGLFIREASFGSPSEQIYLVDLINDIISAIDHHANLSAAMRPI